MRYYLFCSALFISLLVLSCKKKDNPKPVTHKSPTTITNFIIDAKYIGSADFTIPAPQSNNPGDFSYTSSDPSVAVVKGKTLQVRKVGTVEITVSQNGSEQYEPGAAITTFTVLPHVYITGFTYDPEGYLPVYWKDGERHDLQPRAAAMDVYVQNNDVYIAAMLNEGSYGKPAYWKNGTLVRLPGNAGDASKIMVSGADVYVAGILVYPTQFESYVHVIWKNGTILELERPFDCCTARTSIEPTALAITDNKVYICGTAANRISRYPVIWNSDGTVYKVLQTMETNNITQAIVRNGDFYLAGSTSLQDFLTYWKNDQAFSIDNISRNSNAYNTIAVKGPDVYTAGPDFGNAVYWKNGVKTVVTERASVEKMAISGNDIYMTGLRYLSNAIYDYEAVYWFNGEIRRLDAPKGTQTTAIQLVEE